MRREERKKNNFKFKMKSFLAAMCLLCILLPSSAVSLSGLMPVEVDSLSRSVMGYERWREGLQSRIAQRYDLARPHQHLRVESLRGNGEVLQRTSVLRQDPSAQWVLAGSITGLCLLSGHIAAFFCGIVGLLYPAYLSLKALESATPADEGCGARAKNARDPKQELLMYWVCYSILHLAEGIMGPCVSQIQHYEAVKVAVLVWLHRQGARSMYDKWLHSAIKEMEAHTEEVVNTVAMQVEERFVALKAKTSHTLRNLVRSSLSSFV